jgi:hypothetical protein
MKKLYCPLCNREVSQEREFENKQLQTQIKNRGHRPYWSGALKKHLNMLNKRSRD